MTQHARAGDTPGPTVDRLVDVAMAAWAVPPLGSDPAHPIRPPEGGGEDGWIVEQVLDDAARAASRAASPTVPDPDGSATSEPEQDHDAGEDVLDVVAPDDMLSWRGDAGDFTEEAFLEELPATAPSGWRRLVHHLTAGRLTPRPSRAEREWESLLARCAVPLQHPRRIAVVSRKGGVGKTTAALMLGHTYAALRADRVVAVDVNPDAGTLGHRIERQTSLTIGDLLAAAGRLDGFPAVRAHTSQAPSRLEILAGDADPHASRAFGGEEYHAVLEVLEEHYTLILLDSGTGVLDSATSGVLAAADQIVLLSGGSLDEARAAALTCDWLAQQGHDDMVADAVVAMTAPIERNRADLAGMARHFGRRCRAVHIIPRDSHLEAGGIVDPDHLRQETQEAWLRIAADVADGFALPSARWPEPVRR